MTLSRKQVEAAIRRTGASFVGEETTSDGTEAMVFEAEGLRFIAFLTMEERGRFAAMKLWAGFQGVYDAEFANRVNRQLAVGKAVAMDDGGLVVTFDVLLHGLSELAVSKSASFFVLDIVRQLQSS
ncbi:unnamed protein product [Chrysoparadoxa australica]